MAGDDLRARGGDRCELCRAVEDLSGYPVSPESAETAEQSVLICRTCRVQIEGSSPMDSDHWRVLTETMWSQVPSVQVMAWRMLRRLRTEGWASEALEMLYLDDEVRAWAESGDDSGNAEASAEPVVHRDGNGAVLSAGDTVTLTKDLNVKGAGFTAKRGTAVRGISLVQDNAAHIEGRISGQQIVILTEFVKKSG